MRAKEMNILKLVVAHLRMCLILITCISFWACEFNTKKSSFAIEQVYPEIPSLESQIFVTGQGFGQEIGVISLNGRPLELISWGNQQIQAKIPKDASSGNGLLVVQTQAGLNTQPFPLYVTGQTIDRNFDLNFQDHRLRGDLGIIDQALDLMLMDQNLSKYDLEFIHQDSANVLFVPKISADNRLILEIHLKAIQPDPWGMAFHLKYDASRLQLVEETQHIPLLAPDPKQMKMVKAVKPGYLMLMSMYPQTIAFQITFEILETGEMSFQIPLRGRMFKDALKQSQPLIWDEGTLILKTKAE